MAPARRRLGPRKFYRCGRCRSLIPVGYQHCGSCGFNREEWIDATITDIKRIFPGTRELGKSDE